MGIFDDLMYPDNKNRAMRASELGNDCATITVQLIQDKQYIESLLKDTNQAIKDAYGNLAQSSVPIPVETLEIDGQWAIDIVSMLSPIVTIKYAMSGLQAASKAWLVSQGRLGEAAFADLVGLPRWFSVNKVIGGIAAAVAVEAIIDAVDGALNRDKLQDAIKHLNTPRTTLKQHALVNETVRGTLNTVTAAYNALASIPGITKEQLDILAHNLIETHRVDVTKITPQTAQVNLAELDRARGSWTNEG
ncbi:hypothetical protein [Deinococcus sp. Leaf326]|uniref:hypothetical protein n=1 Tax=Deinococcus sp. Leaf326 TaxID=1736338 RepID=UPI000A9B4196|nr:hypothetical protein [Deinococcus sp. Leaf326]